MVLPKAVPCMVNCALMVQASLLDFGWGSARLQGVVNALEFNGLVSNVRCLPGVSIAQVRCAGVRA